MATWKTVLYSLGLFSLCFLGVPVTIHHIDDVETLFKEFTHKYNRTYINNPSEYSRRLEYFRETYNRTKRANELHRPTNAKFGITKFADYSQDEFQSLILRHKLSDTSCVQHRTRSKFRSKKKRQAKSRIPSHVDWRDKGAVSSVKNQLNCGACWAFSTIATIESMKAIQTGNLTEFSVQQVIDCARNGNMGCNGGDTCSALKWMATANVSLLEEQEYPLTLDREQCRMPQMQSEGVRISPNFTCFNLVNNEEEILTLLATHGPLTAAVDAISWQDYLGGIIQFHCEDRPNHAVQIVGYDTTGPVPYYIVRNSWGKDFGIDGYIHIAMGRNLCGIAREVSALNVI